MNDANKDSQTPEESARERLAREIAETHRRWRRVGAHLSRAALRRARALANEAPGEPGGELNVREFGAIVLSAQRAMEMEHSYEQKVQSRDDGEDAGDLERRRQDALRRAEEFAKRMLAEQSETQAQEGVY